jgi:hypothetical protein
LRELGKKLRGGSLPPENTQASGKARAGAGAGRGGAALHSKICSDDGDDGVCHVPAPAL